jgi:molybdopterin-guanine dinucleotide biosynthesis protein B
MHTPPIIAVCGLKNSGKTTFLCGLIPALARLQLRAALIKHDGHDFEPDVAGTDSDRLRRAGALGTAVYSGSRYMLSREWNEPDIGLLTSHFKDAELILLEGGKYSSYKKIEIVRKGISDAPVSQKDTLLAVFSDLPLQIDGVPVYPIDQYAQAAKLIADYIRSLT